MDLVTAGRFSLICVFCAYAVPSSIRRSCQIQVWRVMVHHYKSAMYKRKHKEQKLRKAEMGGRSHTQGSLPLAIVQESKVRKCIALTLIIMFFLISQMCLCIFVLSFAGQIDRLDCIAVQDLFFNNKRSLSLVCSPVRMCVTWGIVPSVAATGPSPVAPLALLVHRELCPEP
jgi:hypothetical protein